MRLNRFIEKCKDKIIPQYIPNSMSSLFFIVYYWKVRESIISYIEQTAGKHIEGLEELKLLFVNKNEIR